MEQQIVSMGSSNLIYGADGKLISPSPFEEYGIVFIDRDGSEHSFPTPAHRGARIGPTKQWEELTATEKESERARWAGLWPPLD